MKKFNFLLVLSLTFLVISCGKDDVPNPEPTPTPEETHYFSLASGNSWDYDNTYDSTGGSHFTGTETLKTKNASNNSSEFTSTVSAEGVSGFFTSALANGKVTRKDNQLLYTGDLVLYKINEDLQVLLPVENVVIYDQDAAEGTTIYEKKDVTSQQDFTVVISGTLNIKYSISIKQGAKQSSLTVAEKSYEDIISSEITFSNVSLIFHLSGEDGDIDQELLTTAENKPLVSTLYFANGIGMVKAEDQVDVPFMDLEDLVEAIIGTPMDRNTLLGMGAPDLRPIKFTVTQELTDYTVK